MDLLRELVFALIERSSGGGKMITSLLKWEIDFTMTYCCTLKVVPFSWDPLIRVIHYCNTRSCEYKVWGILASLTAVHSGLLWLRFCVSVLNGDSFVTLALILFVAASFSIPSACQFVLYLHGSEISLLYNYQILLFKKLESNSKNLCCCIKTIFNSVI